MPDAPAVRSRSLYSYFPEAFCGALICLFMLLWIRQAYNVWDLYPGSDWNSSEWMISYSGGFVRRGFGGAVMMTLVRDTGWSFFPMWVALASALCLALSGWFVYTVAHLRGPVIWRAALLFNPLLFLSASQSGVFLGKDLIFAAATILHVWLVHRMMGEPSRGRTLTLVVMMAVLSSLLALLHEGIFLFAWLPLNFALAAWALSRVVASRVGIVILLAATFGSSLVIVGASVIHHGNGVVAEAIYRGWKPLMPPAYGSGSYFPPGLDALRWNVRDALMHSLGNARYFPLFLLAFAVAGGAYVGALQILIPGSDTRRQVLLLVGPLIAALPLFLLGLDWGRWFYILGASSFPIMIDPTLLTNWRTPTAKISSRPSLNSMPSRALAFMRTHIEKDPWLLVVALVFCPMPPWPCTGGLYAFNPVILILRLGTQKMVLR